MTRIITVASGNGCAGKTFLGIDLAVALAGAGRRTMILDCDSGADNVHARLNITQNSCLADVLDGRIKIGELPSRHPSGVGIVPARPGIERLVMPDADLTGSTIGETSGMDEAEYILIDSSACNPREVVAFCQLSTDVILLLTPDAGVQAQSYALLKILLLNGFGARISVVVNKAGNLASGERIFETFRNTVFHYLAVDLSLMEVIINDPSVRLAAYSRQSPSLVFHQTAAVASVRAIAGQIEHEVPDVGDALTVAQFWCTYARLVQTSLLVSGQLPVRDQEEGKSFTGTFETDAGDRDDQADAERAVTGISDILESFDYERIENPAGSESDELYAIRRDDGSELICAWHGPHGKEV